MKERPFLYGILLISISMLSLETLLPRIFAVYVGPNFVFFSISLALIGLSSGGIIVYVWESFFVKNPLKKMAYLAGAFSLSIILIMGMVNLGGNILNSIIEGIYENVLSDPTMQAGATLSQSIVFPSMVFVQFSGTLFAISFLFVGLCLSIAFRTTKINFGKVYAYDLIGAGIGCAFTVFSLNYLPISTGIILLSLISVVGAILFTVQSGQGKNLVRKRLKILGVIIFSILLISIFIKPAYNFKIHKFSFLRSFYYTPLKELKSQWTPLGRITLSKREWSPPLNAKPRLRPLTFVGMDLGGFSVVEKFSPENLAIIKNTSVFSDDILEPIVVPGLYCDLKNYLVLMAGNGQDMLRAYSRYGDNINLTGVELNPVVFQFGLDDEEAHLDQFFSKPNVTMFIDEGRSFVEHAKSKYDLICLSYSGATFASGNGTLSSTPQFLFTKEAIESYLNKLTDNGILVIIQSTEPTQLPPSLKTFCTALKELEPETDIRKHIVAYTRPGMFQNSIYTIYHRKQLTEENIKIIEKVFEENNLIITYSAFTPSQYPAMQSFFENMGSLDSSFPYPALSQDRIHSDNHPFYYFNLQWGRIGGYLVIGYAVTFLAACFIAIIFLLVPLFFRKSEKADYKKPGWFYFLVFGLIGAGFMFLEVGSIQRFELFLGNPTLALVIILATLLVHTGIGSYFSTRLFDSGKLSFIKTAALTVIYGIFVLFFLNELIYLMMDLHLTFKIVTIVLVLFPLGFLLGCFFPQLLRELEIGHKNFIPWALAINGIFSVASSNLGSIIYLFMGANMVIICGITCYLLLGIFRLLSGKSATAKIG